MTLDERLENWAKAQRLGSGYHTPIGSAEGRYRGGVPAAPNIEVLLIDERDADEVERAWVRLMPFDKDVLRMHFIWRAPPEVICRRLKIRSRPASTYTLALAHAKREIGRILDALDRRRREQLEQMNRLSASITN